MMRLIGLTPSEKLRIQNSFQTPCQYCGKDSASHACDDDGWICERCSVSEGHEWGEQCASCGHGVNDSTAMNKFEELICVDCAGGKGK
jgi:hypothetical protein